MFGKGESDPHCFQSATTRKELRCEKKTRVVSSWGFHVQSCSLYPAQNWPGHSAKPYVAAPITDTIQERLFPSGKFMQLFSEPHFLRCKKGMTTFMSLDSYEDHWVVYLAQSWLFNKWYQYDSVKRVSCLRFNCYF